MITDIEDVVNKHFGTHVVAQTKAGLATVATLALQDNTQPTTLVYVGPSGSGKTLTCNFLTPDAKHKDLKEYIIRVDKFTPKSFVTHAANVQSGKLKDIDLLPKIQDKCLITKELALLFRGNKDELQENFSILISVLDGKGYVSTSGVRGTRGYDYDINFSWIGATTPLTNEVHRLMAQLGTRLVFYNTQTPDRTINDLLTFAKSKSQPKAERESRVVCNEFLDRFFSSHERHSIPQDYFTFPDEQMLNLVRYANLMCYLRAGFSMRRDREETRYSKPEREVPFRAITILKNIAYGSALIHGREVIDETDLLQVQHIAYSSMPEQRRLLFQALIYNEGEMSVNDVCEFVGMSKPTARHYMEELDHLGVCRFDRGSADHTPSSIRLLDEWRWLVRDDWDIRLVR